MMMSQQNFTIEDLEQFFSKDFESLDGMTRTSRDWVLDSVVNPWIGKLFSIEDACMASKLDFRPISMTPNLHLDKAWYKNVYNNKSEKMFWVESYRKRCHELIDYSVTTDSIASYEQNALLIDFCSQIFSEMQIMISSNSLISSTRILEIIARMFVECHQLNISTERALKSFVEFVETGEKTALADFQPFWGRGQQYLCFERSQY
jgi:hypothetical protein